MERGEDISGDPNSDLADLRTMVLDLKRQLAAFTASDGSAPSPRGYTRGQAGPAYEDEVHNHAPRQRWELVARQKVAFHRDTSATVPYCQNDVCAKGKARHWHRDCPNGGRRGISAYSFVEEAENSVLAARFQHAIDHDDAEEFDALCVLAGGKPDIVADVSACSFCEEDGEALVYAIDEYTGLARHVDTGALNINTFTANVPVVSDPAKHSPAASVDSEEEWTAPPVSGAGRAASAAPIAATPPPPPFGDVPGGTEGDPILSTNNGFVREKPTHREIRPMNFLENSDALRSTPNRASTRGVLSDALIKTFDYADDVIDILKARGYPPKASGVTLEGGGAREDFLALRSAMTAVLHSANSVEVAKIFDLELAYASYYYDVNYMVFTMLSVLLRGSALAVYHTTAKRYPLTDALFSFVFISRWRAFDVPTRVLAPTAIGRGKAVHASSASAFTFQLPHDLAAALPDPLDQPAEVEPVDSLSTDDDEPVNPTLAKHDCGLRRE
ncbi:hypothetical protein CYMTET_48067 [Cymbomonas tetramitiformis]|uniref:Uncharacterized protein n=1 Tax=Cymbomonas tetramitiformis TaxID=36881 RepID=A0AAE0BUR8_9CHLO|nr:hypothetical protein CYMTET_48067 [Cymbomonas tetramitiformis]